MVRGHLPEGCAHCHRGGKLVLFITGVCNHHCFYCPLSEKKYGHDVSYANERPVRRIEEVIQEGKDMDASGTGITGGDPLARFTRTCRWIRGLKSAFGMEHHIHLYTATPPHRNMIKRLADAGLDELRVHIPAPFWLDPGVYIQSLRGALGFDLDVGVEVPVLPDKAGELSHMLDTLEGVGISFVNLNELELSDTTVSRMERYEPAGDSYAVKGSYPLGKRLVKAKKRDYTLHLCTVRYKDAGQLRRRLIRRGRKIKKGYQVLTPDGTLQFAIITGDLARLKTELKRLNLSRSLYSLNEKKKRIELAPWIADLVARHLRKEFDIYLIEEYPTWDALEVERIPLR